MKNVHLVKRNFLVYDYSMPKMNRDLLFRIRTAREAIAQAGGPAVLASQIKSRFPGAEISTARIAKWRYTGIPAKYGGLVSIVTGYDRERLNPIVFTDNPQVINRILMAEKRGKSRR